MGSGAGVGYAPEIQLLGISTVAGNQTVEKVTLNALNLLAAAGLSHVGEDTLSTLPFAATSVPTLTRNVHHNKW